MSDLADAMAWAMTHREPFGASEELPPLSLTRAQIAALEAEARRVLAEVEPDDAARERRAHREERACGYVLLAITGTGRERGSRTIEGGAMWRPRATRTRSGWALAGGWLDAAVPELPTRGVPNAGGVRPVVVWSDDDGVRESIRDRSPGVLWVGHVATALGETLVDRLRVPTQVEPALRVPRAAVRETRSWWHRARADLRITADTGGARGWCVGLGASGDAARTSGLAGWRAMQRYCATAMQTTDAQWTEERAAIVAAQSREAT